MKTKKPRPVTITAEEMRNQMILENDECTSTEMMVAFARQKVTEAVHEISEHFKNPDNVSYIKNHYSLDKII